MLLVLAGDLPLALRSLLPSLDLSGRPTDTAPTENLASADLC